MRYLPFTEASKYDVGLFIKPSQLSEYPLKKNYVEAFTGLNVMAFSLEFGDAKKPSAKVCKAYIQEILPIVKEQGIQLLYVVDATYFKQLTKADKVDAKIGYVLDCVIKGFEDLKVVYGINYQSLIYNPEMASKMALTIQAVNNHFSGTGPVIDAEVIHQAFYPASYEEIEKQLESLHQYPELSADIEAFSLKHYKAGIGSISFAWSEHEGTAFLCDYKPFHLGKDLAGHFGTKVSNYAVRSLLKKFFETYQGTLKWHGSTYDLKVLVYTLFMDEIFDNTEGLLKGLSVLVDKFHDTKILAYLALNSTARNSYSLKNLAQPFCGDWAQDEDSIKDIRLIEPKALLKYNLYDTLATNYVFNTYYPKVIADDQLSVYEEIFHPSIAPIIQIELTGMPLNKKAVLEAERELLQIIAQADYTMTRSTVYQVINNRLQHKTMEATNAKLKKKRHPIEAFSHVKFNPNSNQQVQELLYEIWKFPVIDYTKSKQPAVGAKTLEKLLNHTKDAEQIAFIEALIEFAKANKIITSFISAFKEAIHRNDGRYYLHGNFVLGGTVSGRLSSNSPNLQNLPSGSKFGKLIKSCFQAPKGWLMAGADFNSLEDYISALTTKDPNKLKVYLEGYDGHCLRAYSYWSEKFTHIQLAEEGHTCYKANVGGTDFYFKEDDEIEYGSKVYTGTQFFELASSGRL